jgi:hypothetical protein
MTRFAHQNVSFEPPADWIEATVVRFHAPPAPGLDPLPMIVVTREPCPPGESLQTFSTRKLIALAARRADLAILDSEEESIGGRSAIVQRFRFRGPKGAFVESAMALVGTGDDAARLVTVIESMSAPEQSKATDEAFRDMLRRVRFESHKEASSAIPSAPRSDARASSGAVPEPPMPGPRSR